jgi:hypothetical protein
MNRFLTICVFSLTWCTISVAQQIALKEIYPKTIRPDYTRFEYVFSANNDTRHRLNLVGYACLLDAKKNIIDRRFVSFETRPGNVSDCSIESDLAPVAFSENPGRVSFYRLYLRDNAMRKSLELDGDVTAPITQKQQSNYTLIDIACPQL